MAGGKSTKRVMLRAKIARKHQQQQVEPYATDVVTQSTPGGPSASPTDLSAVRGLHSRRSTITDEKSRASPTALPADATGDDVATKRIREAIRQRPGRTTRTPATRVAGSVSGNRGKRKLTKKEVNKAPVSKHPASVRRAAVLERRRLMLPHMTAAEERMSAAQAELQLFDKVQTVPTYAADPFAAVLQHVTATMETLQPQTPDVGRAPQAVPRQRR